MKFHMRIKIQNSIKKLRNFVKKWKKKSDEKIVTHANHKTYEFIVFFYAVNPINSIKFPKELERWRMYVLFCDIFFTLHL